MIAAIMARAEERSGFRDELAEMRELFGGYRGGDGAVGSNVQAVLGLLSRR